MVDEIRNKIMYETISKESKSYNDYVKLINLIESYSEDERKEIMNLTNIGFNNYEKEIIYKKFATKEGIDSQINESENPSLFVFYVTVTRYVDGNNYSVSKFNINK